MIRFPLYRHDGVIIGSTTLEVIRNLQEGGYIEEHIAKPSGLIYYQPTIKGWQALEQAAVAKSQANNV